jgi:hypothetical protein
MDPVTKHVFLIQIKRQSKIELPMAGGLCRESV